MADPLTITGTILGTAVVVGPAVAFFIKAQGKRTIARGDAERDVAQTTKIEAEADAQRSSVIVELLRKAEARAEREHAEATAAREETGQHRAQVEQVKRTYDERLRTMEKLTILQAGTIEKQDAEIRDCNAHRVDCEGRLRVVEDKLGLTPKEMPSVKPPT